MSEIYNESMSLACQWGRCEDCPENGDDYEQVTCSCVHHIPCDTDTSDEYEDELAQRWYENYYGRAQA